MIGMGMIIISLFLLLMTGNKEKALKQRGFMRSNYTDDSRVTNNRGSRKHF